MFYGDSITESWRGTAMGNSGAARSAGIDGVYDAHFSRYRSIVLAISDLGAGRVAAGGGNAAARDARGVPRPEGSHRDRRQPHRLAHRLQRHRSGLTTAPPRIVPQAVRAERPADVAASRPAGRQADDAQLSGKLSSLGRGIRKTCLARRNSGESRSTHVRAQQAVRHSVLLVSLDGMGLY